MSFLLLHRLKPFVARGVVVQSIRGFHLSVPRSAVLGPRRRATVNTDGCRELEIKLKGGSTLNIVKTPGQKLDMATLIYPDNGKYVGQWKLNKKNGFGTYTNSEGDVYQGEWKNGFENGQGIRTYADGSRLLGEFQRGKIHNGQGVLVLSKERRLEGEWRDGKLDGLGRVRTKEGVEFEWTLKEGTETGFGVQRFPDGAVFEGHWLDVRTLGLSRFVEMRRHGPGKFTTSKQQVLQGVWKEGAFLEGHGTMVLPHGEVLEGTWVQGEMEGPGKFFSPELMITYVGDFHQGLKHGLGLVRFKSGAKYEGEFSRGLKHGQGRYTSHSGEVLDGQWDNDKFCGAAHDSVHVEAAESVESTGEPRAAQSAAAPAMTNSSTALASSSSQQQKSKKEKDAGKYAGELEDGKPHGHGTLTTDSVTYVGMWRNGQRNGPGRETSAYGAAEGEFRFDRMYNGSGVLLLRNEVHEGVWVDGRMQGAGVIRDLHHRSRYEGCFLDGRMHGPGSVLYSNGNRYVGGFQAGKQHGEGRLMDADGAVLYHGEWKDNRRHGRGWALASLLKKSELPERLREEGGEDRSAQRKDERIEGVWHGGRFLHEEPLPDRLSELAAEAAAEEKEVKEVPVAGELKYPDGSNYAGDVLHGLRHGQGTHTSADGRTTYTGEWRGDKRCGQGTTTSPKGQCVGEYRNGKIFLGAGLMELPNGDVHEGHWEQGLLQGRNIHTDIQRRTVYDGQVDQGRKHGQGVLTHLDGEFRYTGAFERGFQHGQGTQVAADGSTYTGEWEKGRRHGQGRLVTRKGWTEGEFRDDKIYNGTGEVYVAKLGKTVQRVWVEGVLKTEEPDKE